MIHKRAIAAFVTAAVLAGGCASLRLPLISQAAGSQAAGSQGANSAAATSTATGQTVNVVNAPAAAQPTPTALPDSARIQFDQDEQVLINLYERVDPAVVSIVNSQNTGSGSGVQPAGQGSGFVISQDGYIVTNNHVVEGADQLDVNFSDGTSEQAKVIGTDPYSDLALIKVNRTGLSFVEMGDSNQVKVGQKVIAIGNPFGLDGTMTTGIVSAKGRTLPESAANVQGNFTNPDIIQTDAAINPGNSGGPLLDSHGRVIGVNTAIRSTGSSGFGAQPSNSGIGFAVPSNTVKRVIDALRVNGHVTYPYLGIQGQIPFSAAKNANLNLGVSRGVIVLGVAPGGPVAKAGLRPATVTRNGNIQQLGDIITAFNGQPIRDYDELIAKLTDSTKPGDTVTLTVFRDGKSVDLKVTLGERPS